MAYRLVETGIWQDDGAFPDLSVLAKLVFFRLMTGPETTASGALKFRLPMLAASIGEGVSRDDLEAALAELVRADLVRSYDGGWWYVKRFTRHQARSPSFLSAAERSVKTAPEALKKAVQREGEKIRDLYRWSPRSRQETSPDAGTLGDTPPLEPPDTPPHTPPSNPPSTPREDRTGQADPQGVSQPPPSPPPRSARLGGGRADLSRDLTTAAGNGRIHGDDIPATESEAERGMTIHEAEADGLVSGPLAEIVERQRERSRSDDLEDGEAS